MYLGQPLHDQLLSKMSQVKMDITVNPPAFIYLCLDSPGYYVPGSQFHLGRSITFHEPLTISVHQVSTLAS